MLKTIVMLRAVNHIVNSPQKMKEISCIENRPYKIEIIFQSSVKKYKINKDVRVRYAPVHL